MRSMYNSIAVFTIVATTVALHASDLEYRGVVSCRKCHLATTNGNQYEKWVESAHSNAYNTLTTAESFKIAKAKNIADPTKSADCLRCHVTAYDVPAEKKGKAFDVTLGTVQQRRQVRVVRPHNDDTVDIIQMHTSGQMYLR